MVTSHAHTIFTKNGRYPSEYRSLGKFQRLKISDAQSSGVQKLNIRIMFYTE